MRGVHKKSPLSASGLESFTAFAYNSAPRTNACRLLNRYANQYIAVLPVVMLALLVIIRGFPYRALVYFVFRRITTGFYRTAAARFTARRAARQTTRAMSIQEYGKTKMRKTAAVLGRRARAYGGGAVFSPGQRLLQSVRQPAQIRGLKPHHRCRLPRVAARQ
jgi:hypothetical protein